MGPEDDDPDSEDDPNVPKDIYISSWDECALFDYNNGAVKAKKLRNQYPIYVEVPLKNQLIKFAIDVKNSFNGH